MTQIIVNGNIVSDNSGGSSGSSDELQRVDNDTWETPQVGVEYYSDNQVDGMGDTVYKQFFSGTLDGSGDATLLADASFIDRIITSKGQFSGSDYSYPMGISWANDYTQMPRKIGDALTVIANNSTANNAPFTAVVEYTKK